MSRNRDTRREAAQAHINDMYDRYLPQTESSITHTILYASHPATMPIPTSPNKETLTVVRGLGSVSAIFDYEGEGKVSILDFASYRNPGGGYDNGAWAQEEALCSESNLFNILDAMRGRFYDPNHKTLNRSLYTDRSMYVPDVIFERNGKIRFADVIVCAAPNTGAAFDHGVSLEECKAAMKDRVSTVMNIAADRHVDHLILGAFGCGVFRNDPADVAQMFKAWIEDHPGQFESVVFAIPAGGENLEVFKDVFE